MPRGDEVSSLRFAASGPRDDDADAAKADCRCSRRGRQPGAQRRRDGISRRDTPLPRDAFQPCDSLGVQAAFALRRRFPIMLIASPTLHAAPRRRRWALIAIFLMSKEITI